MAENQEQKSKRDLYMERLKTKYPDREYADDEALFGQINDDYDEYDKQLNEYRGREDKLTEQFAKNPKAAQFFVDLSKGVAPETLLVQYMGLEGITDLLNNPEKKEELAKANEVFLENLAKEKNLSEEYEKNLGESLAEVERLKEEKQLKDEVLDAAWAEVVNIANEAIMGKITRETLEMAMKALNHEAEVENARSEGELAGRNAKIEETMRKPTGGDGMPVMGGTSGAAEQPKQRGFFDDLPKRKF